MAYKGRVKGGVVVFEGAERPLDGTEVRVEVVTQPAEADNVGEQLARLAGKAQGLRADHAERRDHYRRERRPE